MFKKISVIVLVMVLAGLTSSCQWARNVEGPKPPQSEIERTVKIEMLLGDKDIGGGSAVVMGDLHGHAILATAWHVVNDLDVSELVVAKTDEYGKCRLRSKDARYDIAILYCENPSNLPKLKFRSPVIGEHIRVFGYPSPRIQNKRILNITDGVVSGNLTEVAVWRITAPAWFGNSGGPVFGDDGQLVCLTTNIIPGQAGYTFCRDAEYLRIYLW